MKIAEKFSGKWKLIIIVVVMLISWIVPDALPFVDEVLLLFVAVLEYQDYKKNN